jgi:hypothetical protein
MATSNASEWIGLSKHKGQDLCEARNMIFRLLSVDGEAYFSMPDESEKRTDRVCVDIVDTRIVKAIIH